MTMDREFLGHLRRVGILEGCSTLVLFGIAMPLKYLAGLPLAVTIVGTIHGVFFMLLVAMFLLGRERIPITLGLTHGGLGRRKSSFPKTHTTLRMGTRIAIPGILSFAKTCLLTAART